jgi:hypothetical protein
VSHYVYALADPRDGRYRYVGGAYGNANRMNEHVPGCPTKSLRAWLPELHAAGFAPLRRVLLRLERREHVFSAERAVWDMIKAAGHPLLNARPGYTAAGEWQAALTEEQQLARAWERWDACAPEREAKRKRRIARSLGMPAGLDAAGRLAWARQIVTERQRPRSSATISCAS